MKDAATRSFSKKGEAIVKMNHDAIDAGFDYYVKIDVPADWANAEDKKVEEVLPGNNKKLINMVQTIMEPVAKMDGDSLPVSAFVDHADGTFEQGAAAYEKRGVAVMVPVWDETKCIQCNRCSYVCPHATIRPFALSEEEVANAPAGLQTAKTVSYTHLDEILRVSDGIMIARGDMGVEIPLEEVPVIQKMIIRRVYNSGKYVITATQMLDSMMNHPRPTRAETNDVANAIYDGTSVIMLSGETAAGKYPVEAIRTMSKIAERTENDINYRRRFRENDSDSNRDVTNAISHATCAAAYDLEASAIITVTPVSYTHLY